MITTFFNYKKKKEIKTIPECNTCIAELDLEVLPLR